MSSEFTVYLPGLKNSAEEFPDMYRKVNQEKEALQRICNHLKGDPVYGRIADEVGDAAVISTGFTCVAAA
ncbi:MAG: hypothetical protein J5986_14380 [Roseburia sp.]|nr:hypothetical protein [Roseburia sp.]